MKSGSTATVNELSRRQAAQYAFTASLEKHRATLARALQADRLWLRTRRLCACWCASLAPVRPTARRCASSKRLSDRREYSVFVMLWRKEMKIKEIAAALGVTPRMVNNHKRSIKAKMKKEFNV
ncbi:luxR family protein [Xanthomonas phage KPhi1]|uniref:LuxR family protein n=1 Tax=Xanthomonas phage KPhi1 TaxID=1927017 RepID=A0A3G1GLF0_9CAUD|nr:luxR family protein [Xanthomonas phage KPhi1]APQ41919.1 luxR family protein [Xanthomonas phage KPhi1]